MPDPRFFARSGPFALEMLAEDARATLGPGVDVSALISDVAPLSSAGAQDLSYVNDRAWLPALTASACGACVVEADLVAAVPAGRPYLIAADARLAFAKIAARFYPDPGRAPDAGPATIAADAIVAASATIGAGARLGSGVRVDAGAVIGPGVEIGAGSRIGANASLTHCIVGPRCLIHPGVRIGQDGFGFVPSPEGLLKMPQLGRVLIGADVEIGANCCIDRGALEDTAIGDGTKIDNLVQIGHNVRIGRHCVIVAQVGISGSCTIGDRVVIGGQAGLADHVHVGDGAQIAAKTGIMRDVGPGEVVMGYPARPIRQFWREIAALARLTRREKQP